ncbi:phage tail spike protein [Lacticaseibacillus suilingensis]|uniref:Phage tail spike protein n=1 Tax=Lacticaseibacillus suilingensis TaxID=2799577 RepID=A0ABW4BF34_9LACO|nr:phage tail spike protein [Lacticaseibacillus suilingensis]
MIVHFLDREYHQIGTASTEGGATDIRISDNNLGEFKSVADGYTSYKADVTYTPEQSALVQQMATAGQFILYKDRNGNPVWMEINDFSHDPGSLTDEISAEGASMDLLNETVGAYAADKAYPIAEYIQRFISDSGYEIGVNEIPDITRTLSWDSIGDTALARILSVATQFGVELDFDFDIDGLNVLHRYINIRKQIGGDKAVKLYQNVNLNDVRTEVNKDDLCTSIYGTGATPEGADAPITLVGYKWTDPDGRFVLGGDGILRDTVAVQTWSRLRNANDPAPTRSHIQRVMTYEAQTQAQLLQSVLSDLKKYNHPTVTYEADIALLPDNIDIGDTIGLVDEGESLYLSARVLELNYSYSLESGTAKLGDYLVQTDQVDPAYRELAEALAKQNKGKDGVGLKSSVVTYQAGTSGTTAPTGEWSNTVPEVAPSQFLWSRTVLTMTDGSSSTTYSVGKIGDNGAAGADGNGVQSSLVSYQVGTSGTTAPTGTWSSSVPTASQGTYLWSRVITTYTNGTQNTAYSVAYQAKDGAKGDPGSQDVPMTYIQTDQPAGTIVKDSLWWVGTAMNNVTGLKRWNGSDWVPETIAQAVLNIKELNAVTINSGSLNSPLIKVPFEHMAIDSENTLGSGTMTLDGPKLTLDGTIDGGTQKFEVQMSASGFSSIITGADGDLAHPNQMATLIKGELDLQLAYAGSGANKSYVSSVFDAGAAAHYFKRETVPATANFTNAFIEYARRGNQVTATFHFDLLSETGWVGLEMPPASYKPESWYVSTDLISTSYQGWRCGIYFNSQGWRLLPTAGQGKGTYQGAVSYTTLDDYPYGDVKY